jgi:hypothetical protein
MALSEPAARHVTPSGAPTGLEPLDVRERYLRRRRLRDDRGWIGLWVTVFAVMSWLLVVGLTGFGH